jgi:hypothetical protein
MLPAGLADHGSKHVTTSSAGTGLISFGIQVMVYWGSKAKPCEYPGNWTAGQHQKEMAWTFVRVCKG